MGGKVRAKRREEGRSYDRAAWAIAPPGASWSDFFSIGRPIEPMFAEEWRDVRDFRPWEGLL